MAENSAVFQDNVTIPERADVSSKPPKANPAGIWANRNLRLLWVGESVSLLGDNFYLVALPWLVLQLTGSAIAVGTILAVAGIPRALLMLVGGVFTDRMSPRLIMLLSNGARIVITGLLTLLVASKAIQVWMLYGFSLAFGLVDAFFHPAYMAILPAIVEEEDLASANASVQGTSLIVSAIGPGIGGALIKLVGISSSFFLDTISFAVAAYTEWRMKPTNMEKAPAEHTSVLTAIREAIFYLAKDDLMGPMILIAMALNFLFIGPLMVGPAVLAKVRFVEQGSVALGLLLSGMGLGSLIGMLAGGMLKPSRIGLVTLCSIAAAGLGIVAMGFAPTLAATAVLFAVVGASVGFSNLLMITWLQRHISKEIMGRVMSIFMLSSMGLMPISTAVSGFIAEYNLTLLFVLNGSLLSVAALVSLLNKKLRAIRAEAK